MRLLFIVLIYVKSPHIPGVSLSAPPPQSIGASEQMCSSWNAEMLIFNNPIVCIFIFDGWWGWMLRNSQCYKSPGPHKSYRVTNDLEYETRVSKQKYLCLCTQDTNLFLNISKGLTWSIYAVVYGRFHCHKGVILNQRKRWLISNYKKWIRWNRK